MKLEQKKIRFILAWYNAEKHKLSTLKKLQLLKNWIESCVGFEEYEMAIALKKERNKIIREHRIDTYGKRGVVKYLKLRLKIFLRKIKRLF